MEVESFRAIDRERLLVHLDALEKARKRKELSWTHDSRQAVAALSRGPTVCGVLEGPER